MSKVTDDFIRSNIHQINEKITFYKGKEPNDTEIKNYLQQKFLNEVDSYRHELIKDFKDFKLVKSKIKDIANKYYFYKTDLEKYFDTNYYRSILDEIDTNDLKNTLFGFLETKFSKEEYRYSKNKMDKTLDKLLYLFKIDGFSNNLLGINSGIMLANSGDSAQFLFLSRAILAGFNCSNVDVRSSRYDAIIDFNNKLLRIQVKGISSNRVSFKDRARGGQGIDHTHERNVGKLITSDDCDIYVAVDKQCGICYIIPMKAYVDKLPEDERENISLDRLECYKENWNVIKEISIGTEII